MMHKKHLLQNNDIIKAKKESIDNSNAKVTVQYIQNPQLFQNPNNANNNNIHNMVHASQDDLEIENVEYLEENTNVEEYIEEPCEKDELEDSFYPNAIYCLLDLYKAKYESLITKNNEVKVDELWRGIAKDMQESFFEFNESQIQHKYALLREQYLGVQTKEDVDNFDYFDQLHDIYKDLSKDNISKGLNSGKASRVYYKDEIFLQPEHLESTERNLHDFKSDEIVHKEHEFIDMVEKELQAMEDSVPIEDKESIGNETHQKKTTQGIALNNLKIIRTSIEQLPQHNKRARLDSESVEEPLKIKPKLTEHYKPNSIKEDICYSCNKTSNDISLLSYNKEQERRHREKMSLLEKSLQIQERALEQQQQLLQELIKRLSS